MRSCDCKRSFFVCIFRICPAYPSCIWPCYICIYARISFGSASNPWYAGLLGIFQCVPVEAGLCAGCTGMEFFPGKRLFLSLWDRHLQLLRVQNRPVWLARIFQASKNRNNLDSYIYSLQLRRKWKLILIKQKLQNPLHGIDQNLSSILRKWFCNLTCP